MRKVQIIPQCQRPAVLLRTCGYARVSTDGEDQLESFVTQVEYYTTLIKKNPEWIYAGVYADEGITGTFAYRRDEFNQMIGDCRKGKIDLIITKSISRFARNTYECIQVIRELKQLGIGIYFEKERIHTLSAEGELALTIYSSVAQEEAVSISQNAKWAIQRRMQEGSWLISCVAYGYEKDDCGELIPRQDEARVVRRIYDEFLSGQGCHVIARGLNQDGIPSPRGRSWTESTIRGILLNEIYTGDLLCQKSFIEDTIRHRKKVNRGEYPKYLIPDDHEAIVPRGKAALVRETMELRRKLLHIGTRPRMYRERYPFSSLMICEECGARYKRQKIRITESNRYIQWTCKTHIEDRGICTATGVKEKWIENAFMRLARKLHENKDILLVSLLTDVRGLQMSRDVQERMDSYNSEILGLEKQIQMFRRHVCEGTMDPAIFIQKSHQIKGDIASLKELRNRELERESLDGLIEELKQLIHITGKDVRKGMFDEELFAAIVKQVIITKDKKIRFHLLADLCLTEDLTG